MQQTKREVVVKAIAKSRRAAHKFQKALSTPRATNRRNSRKSLDDEASFQLSSKTSQLLVEPGNFLAFS